MAFIIDITTWRKDTRLPLGHGYSMRPSPPSSIVIHSTNNDNLNTAFTSEAKFLRDSSAVGAHFLVGKSGQIVQFLHPDLAAWHAGGKQRDGSWSAQQAYDNNHSIGIELHISVGERPTTTQRDALAWLVRQLLRQYHIAPEQVDTHRAIALPKGRKSDPEGWSNADFYAWRDQLVAPPPPTPLTKRYRVRRVLISQPEVGGPPYAGELLPGEEVEVNKWYTTGMVHLADGRGFVKLSDLEAM